MALNMNILHLNQVANSTIQIGISPINPDLRGVLATHTIPANTLIVRIQRQDMINRKDSPFTMLRENSQFTNNAVLAITLLNASLQDSCQWTPYIKSLPTRQEIITHPLFYTPADAKAFLGTSIMQRDISPNFPKYVESVHQECDKLYKLKLIPNLSKQEFTSKYMHYRALVGSRVFSTSFGGALVPIADLLNHSDNINVRWSFNPATNSFEMFTTSQIDPGQELYDSYGKSLSNNRRLLHYGFTVEPNLNYEKFCLRCQQNKVILGKQFDMTGTSKQEILKSIAKKKQLLTKKLHQSVQITPQLIPHYMNILKSNLLILEHVEKQLTAYAHKKEPSFLYF